MSRLNGYSLISHMREDFWSILNFFLQETLSLSRTSLNKSRSLDVIPRLYIEDVTGFTTKLMAVFNEWNRLSSGLSLKSIGKWSQPPKECRSIFFVFFIAIKSLSAVTVNDVHHMTYITSARGQIYFMSLVSLPIFRIRLNAAIPLLFSACLEMWFLVVEFLLIEADLNRTGGSFADLNDARSILPCFPRKLILLYWFVVCIISVYCILARGLFGTNLVEIYDRFISRHDVRENC